MSVTHHVSRRPHRVLAACLLAGGAVLLPAAAASAHVRVIPESTAAGDFTKLTFRVPTESDTASTIKLAVELPARTPLAFVSVQPVAGWTAKVTTAKLATPVTVEGTTVTKAPSRVTWTAGKGQGVSPGEFQEFSLSAGPLPDESQELSFPATQTYSDGTVVRWNQPQPAGSDEPEYPVPAFAVTAAKTEAGAAASNTGKTGTAPASTTATTTSTTDGTARALGIGGIVVGVLGITLAAAAFATRKRAGVA